MNTASDDLDVIVTIGTERCNITGFTNIQLECSPPLNEPSPTDDMNITTHTEFPAVIVSCVHIYIYILISILLIGKYNIDKKIIN